MSDSDAWSAPVEDVPPGASAKFPVSWRGAKVEGFVVNFDGIGGEQLADQIRKLGIETPALLQDPASLLGYERPKALPTTLVFGPDGKLRQTLQGPQTEASLAAAIGEPKP